MPQSRRMRADAPAETAVRDSVSDQAGLSLSEPLLDAPEAAALLNVRVSWVRDAAREHVLPCVRVGRHLRFTKMMLEDWLVEQFESSAARETTARAGWVYSSGARSRARPRRTFRAETDAALLAALAEHPARGAKR